MIETYTSKSIEGFEGTEIRCARGKAEATKQCAPVKFGEPFDPNSVEGVQLRRRQTAAIRRREVEEAENAEIDARQAAEEERLAKRSFLEKIWDLIFG